VKKILKIFGWLLLAVVVGVTGLLIYVKTALPEVGEAPKLKAEGTPANIERGRYLANAVCACMDCHSSRDWTKFSGPLLEGTLGAGGERFDQKVGFPGVFYSKNITPYGLKNWTDGEIFRAVTSGVDAEGKALFPVMPYHAYGNMSVEDISAIIAYLRTLPEIKKEVPASEADFPMNFLLNTIPEKGEHLLKADESDPLKYGQYMTNAAVCLECHTQQEKGKRLEGMDFAGGFQFILPGDDTVRSSNITPDRETGIGAWTEDFFVKRFKMHSDSGYVPPAVQPGQFQTLMPWIVYSRMTEKDLKAIYAYLRTVKPVKNAVRTFSPKG